MTKQSQFPGILLRVSQALVLLLLFLAPAGVRWVLVYHHVGNLLPEFSSTLFYLTDALVLVVLLLWLLAQGLDPGVPIHLDPWWVTLPLLGLALWTGLSTAWAISRAVAIELFVRLLLLLALYLLLRNQTISWRAAAWACSVGLAVQGAMATVQFYLQRPIGLSFLGEGPAVLGPDRWVRGYGLSPNPNILGGYLVLGLAATLALDLAARRVGEHLGLLVLAGVGTAGLLSTFSRSAWFGIALALGLPVAVILISRPARARWGSRLFHFGLVVLAVGLIMLATRPAYFASRLVLPLASQLGLAAPAPDSPELVDLATRADYAQVAWQLIGQHLPLGVGGANFTLASYLLQPDRPPGYTFLPVHNVPLLMTAELGPAGGGLWLCLLVVFALALWRNRAALAQRADLLGWSVALLALFAIGWFDFYTWGWQAGRLFWWLAWGLWARSWADVGAG